eukprot:1150446-Pelagomonas_calceolata.AAC.2
MAIAWHPCFMASAQASFCRRISVPLNLTPRHVFTTLHLRCRDMNQRTHSGSAYGSRNCELHTRKDSVWTGRMSCGVLPAHLWVLVDWSHVLECCLDVLWSVACPFVCQSTESSIVWRHATASQANSMDPCVPS